MYFPIRVRSIRAEHYFEEENKKLELVNTKINVNIKKDLGGKKLPSLLKISKYFTF